jgi:hypothetical protein
MNTPPEKEGAAPTKRQPAIDTKLIQNYPDLTAIKSANLRFTQEQAAKLMGVSRRLVQYAAQIRREAPDLSAEIQRGELSIPTALKRLAERKHKSASPCDIEIACIAKMTDEWPRIYERFLAKFPAEYRPMVRRYIKGHAENACIKALLSDAQKCASGNNSPKSENITMREVAA